MKSISAWWKAKVRCLEAGNWYIRLTPNFGLGFPIPSFGGRKKRIRIARHHGVQLVEWFGARWVVTKQILGHSTVNKESFAGD